MRLCVCYMYFMRSPRTVRMNASSAQHDAARPSARLKIGPERRPAAPRAFGCGWKSSSARSSSPPTAPAEPVSCGRPAGFYRYRRTDAGRQNTDRAAIPAGNPGVKRLKRRPVLPHDRYPAVRRQCDDSDIILLADRMIQLRRRVGGELDLALDDFHPRRNARGAAGFDPGPIFSHGSHPQRLRHVARCSRSCVPCAGIA